MLAGGGGGTLCWRQIGARPVCLPVVQVLEHLPLLENACQEGLLYVWLFGVRALSVVGKGWGGAASNAAGWRWRELTCNNAME